MGYSCRTLLRDTLLRHSSGTLLRDTLVGLSSSSPDTPRTKVVLQGRQFSASSSPDTPRTTVVLQGRQFSASSSTGQIALSPAFRALNTHDLRRGLHFRLTLFVPPSAFKENLESGGMLLVRISPVKAFHAYTCILTLACLHLDTYTCMLALGCFHVQNFHLDTAVPL